MGHLTSKKKYRFILGNSKISPDLLVLRARILIINKSICYHYNLFGIFAIFLNNQLTSLFFGNEYIICNRYQTAFPFFNLFRYMCHFISTPLDFQRMKNTIEWKIKLF